MLIDDVNGWEPYHVKEIEGYMWFCCYWVCFRSWKRYVVLPLLVPLFSSPVISMSFSWQVNPMYDWSEVVGCVRRVEREQHEGIFLQSCSLD